MVEQLARPQYPAPPRSVVDTVSDLPPVVPLAVAPTLPPQQRRRRAMRRWLTFTGALVLIPLITAAIMIAQHSAPFFVFRSSGIGETPQSALAENQGPGQPSAPALRAHPAPVKSVLIARSPNSRLTAKPGTWVAVAELHNGKWVIVATGATYAEVTDDAGWMLGSHPGKYMSKWIVIPVKE